MVLPHKFTMPLIDSVDNAVLKCPDSAGVLRVRLHRASDLLKKDVGVMGMGKSDPYATITVGAKKATSNRLNNTVNPVWNYVAEFPIEVCKDTICVLCT
jgi:Ca2+-dependent lipid-binding protein